MFGNDSFDDDSEEEKENQSDIGFTDPIEDDSAIGGDPFGELPDESTRLPWEDLEDETKEDLREQVDNSMCDHDEARQVVPLQSGSGVQFGGFGVNNTTSAAKIACPVCGGEWDTRDQSDQSSESIF